MYWDADNIQLYFKELTHCIRFFARHKSSLNEHYIIVLENTQFNTVLNEYNNLATQPDHMVYPSEDNFLFSGALLEK